MKIKELVKRLSEFDEESEVAFEAWSYNEELYVDRVEIFKNVDINGVEKAVIDIEIT